MIKRFALNVLLKKLVLVFVVLILITFASYRGSSSNVGKNLESLVQPGTLNLMDDDGTKCVCSEKCPEDPKCKCCTQTEFPNPVNSDKTKPDTCPVTSPDSSSDKDKIQSQTEKPKNEKSEDSSD